jgi:hypothetical protein
MSVPFEFNFAGASSYLAFPICSASASANLRGKTFRARVFLETQDQSATTPFVLQLFTDKTNEAFVNTMQSAGTWIILEGTIPASEDPSASELQIWVGGYQNPKWSGKVWADDVIIE